MGQMVANLTVGKKRYAEVETEVISMMERLTAARGEMTRLIDEDGEVFAPLAAAYGLPTGTEEEKEYKVGDIVQFHGGPHYISSTAGSPAGNPKAGPAKITLIAKGAKHPWHLIHTDSSSWVYGWVDDGSFS